ncbi:MAG: hypothetical protein Q3961_05270 [Bifidobacteriaceae bacterium]|nr:hypothetical protein [Bifidobacteriaceae bacterium]
MFKRIFWFAAGMVAGVMTVLKSQAFVRENTPEPVSNFLFGVEIPGLSTATLQALFERFNKERSKKERSMTAQYEKKHEMYK